MHKDLTKTLKERKKQKVFFNKTNHTHLSPKWPDAPTLSVTLCRFTAKGLEICTFALIITFIKLMYAWFWFINLKLLLNWMHKPNFHPINGCGNVLNHLFVYQYLCPLHRSADLSIKRTTEKKCNFTHRGASTRSSSSIRAAVTAGNRYTPLWLFIASTSTPPLAAPNSSFISSCTCKPSPRRYLSHHYSMSVGWSWLIYTALWKISELLSTLTVGSLRWGFIITHSCQKHLVWGTQCGVLMFSFTDEGLQPLARKQ